MVPSQEQPRHYFAFGSNMNPTRVRARGLLFDEIIGARLDGFELTFDKRARDHPHAGRANIRRRFDGVVEGVLYRLIDEVQIEKMDRFEGTPHQYTREVVRVDTGSVVQWAWTYVANPDVVVEGLLPDRAYLEHLLAGRDFLSEAYLDRLSRWPLR